MLNFWKSWAVFCRIRKIPASLAKQVTESISIPTIGIGAGPDCDGQVLVFHDMVGMNKGFSPKFLRRYLDLLMKWLVL